MTPALAAAGADVIGLDIAWSRATRKRHEDLTVVDGDVRDLTQMRDVIAEAASTRSSTWPPSRSWARRTMTPFLPLTTNIAGTWCVLEACRLAPSTPAVVVASSDKAYGEGGAAAYEENMPLQARHPYAVSKACTDLIAQTYAESYGLPVGISRCGNLYGGGDLNWSRIVRGRFAVLEGQRPPHPVRRYPRAGLPVRRGHRRRDVAAHQSHRRAARACR